ncbi:hypothetical protein [Minwuia thermotolerans]|uniref:Uncharacterized protein n=1 Tax=Minwuia thermotolerans TaxID=2056226 RepID=A0A2M9G1T8_9PROT|nr:hypothetical protein [Minwuia thermotolerans]PJK29687.1 hypothetical protein CVT23_11630 [Minwuia thermotolerans]
MTALKAAIGELDEFTDEERWQAEDLVRRFGPEAENVTTAQMIEALESGEIERIVSRVRMRRCVRKLSQKEPYMRRLTDKIAAAVEQALEQGRVSLAQRLRPAFSAAREAEIRHQEDRRAAQENAELVQL